MPTRVLIAVGQQVWRDSLHIALSNWDGVEVVAQTGDGREAVSLAIQLRPDIAVVEAMLPGINGPDVARLVAAEKLSVAVIVIASHADWDVVARSMRAGASGYVLAGGGLDELRRAFEAVAEGRIYMSPAAETAVLTSLERLTQDATANILTPREREVLQLMSEGRATKEIADALDVSAKTIETHRRQLMKKLGIFSVALLTKFAIRNRLTSLDE